MTNTSAYTFQNKSRLPFLILLQSHWTFYVNRMEQVHQSTSKEKCGVLSYMSSLDSIGPIMSEIHNLVFSWRLIKLKLWRHGHTVWRKMYLWVSLYVHLVVMTLILIRILIWWKPWDKYVKVKMWNMAKMATKCKMARFLLRFSLCSKRLFCMIGHETPWLRFLGKSVQGKPMGCVPGGAAEPFCHAFFLNTPECYIYSIQYYTI